MEFIDNNTFEVIKQIESNRKNMFKALQPTFEFIHEMQQRRVNATKPLIDKLELFQSNMYKVGMDISQRIKEASDDVDRCKAILLEYGFPPHYDMDIKQMRKIARYYIDNGKEATHSLLDGFFVQFFTEERINKYRERWMKIEWLQERHSILNEATRSHMEGMYYASISTLLPQIEGVVFTHNEFVGKTSTKKLIDSMEVLLAEKGSFSLDDSVHLFYVNFVLDNFVFGQEIKSPLSRHAIAHGGDTRFGYKLNSIRCIVLFDYLIHRCENGAEE